MRTTKQQLYISFAFLCRNMQQKYWVPAPYGKLIKENEGLHPYYCETLEVGCFFLDFNGYYGGWGITEFLDKGCEHHPLGYARLPISKMVKNIEFANKVLYFQKHKQPNQ